MHLPHGNPYAAYSKTCKGLDCEDRRRATGQSDGDVARFFQEILDRIELESVREAVTAALEARIPQV